MYQDKVTLCGSNAYEKKYYLNPDFLDYQNRSNRNCRLHVYYLQQKSAES